MTEREEQLRYLVEEVGCSPDEAERLLQNDDLWLLPPQMRGDTEALEPEETVRQWERAYYILDDVAELMAWSSEAAWMAVRDAQQRVEIALERARRRAA